MSPDWTVGCGCQDTWEAVVERESASSESGMQLQRRMDKVEGAAREGM